MKELREELIDFVNWLNTPSYCNDIPVRIVDEYLESINSEAGNETPTVTDNEHQEKDCLLYPGAMHKCFLFPHCVDVDCPEFIIKRQSG